MEIGDVTMVTTNNQTSENRATQLIDTGRWVSQCNAMVVKWILSYGIALHLIQTKCRKNAIQSYHKYSASYANWFRVPIAGKLTRFSVLPPCGAGACSCKSAESGSTDLWAFAMPPDKLPDRVKCRANLGRLPRRYLHSCHFETHASQNSMCGTLWF